MKADPTHTRQHGKLTQRSRRLPDGSFLLELLVTCSITGILAVGIMGNMSQIFQFSTSAQNQVTAATIAQQLIDNARNTPYAALESYVPSSPFTLLINRTDSGQTGPLPAQRPLLVDFAPPGGWPTIHWVQPTASGSSWTYPTMDSTSTYAQFQGTATETIQAVSSDLLRVTVTVQWQEKGTTPRKLQIATFIARNGINCQ